MRAGKTSRAPLMNTMHLKIFLSGDLQLRGDLARHNAEVKIRECFKNLGSDRLDVYIAHCRDAVIQIVGDTTGSERGEGDRAALLKKCPEAARNAPPVRRVIPRSARNSARAARRRLPWR
jgi:hypothetical protein